MDELDTSTGAPEAAAALDPAPPRGRRAKGPRELRCEFAAPGAFNSDDPRAGHYAPGQILRIPEDVSAEKAQALLDGGGFAVEKE